MNKNLVTQGEIGSLTDTLGALADNLNQHVNDSLSLAHGWTLEFGSYLDSGGNYHTDFSASAPHAIPGVLNTGVNADGSLATPGTAEQHWLMIQSPTSSPSFVENNPAPYAFRPTHSQWIGPNSNGGNDAQQGSYKYRLTFNLTGLNPSGAVLSGGFLSDNATVAVYLNGVATGITAPDNAYQFGSLIQFVLKTGFVNGINTLDFLVNNSGGPTAFVCEITGTASVGGPVVIGTLFNTGVDNSNSLLPASSVDPHWKFIENPDPSNPGTSTFVVNDAGGVIPFGGPAPVWSKNGPKSKWIGCKANQSSGQPYTEPNTSGPGTYIYRLTFSLAGFNPNTVVIKGLFVSDNATTDIRLNGVSTGFKDLNTTDFVNQPFVSFLLTSGFVSGNNTLDFVVTNPTLSPSGLRVEIGGTAQLAGTNNPGRVLRVTIGSTELFVPAQLSGGIDGKPDATIPTTTGAASALTADPASDLIVGSPTNCALVTTFASEVTGITDSANAEMFNHAGDIPENVHSGLSWQQDLISTSAGYVVGHRSINIVINGVAYKIVAGTTPTGPTS